jgi:preprotein translocase subunit SecA
VLGAARNQVRRLLERPGTFSLSQFTAQLPAIAAREEALLAVPDDELAGLARGAGEASAANSSVSLLAVAREAARRALRERPYDVQVLGALAMLAGNVAEMATGEGKTLVAAMTAAGYALRGRSVHVVSVNDYLARRDAEWMRPVYDLLGVSVGWLGQLSARPERCAAHAAQVTYASVSEIGFDVLRDRLRTAYDEQIVPALDVAVIDEADSVLIDEARVPLVLAGAAEDGSADHQMARIVQRLMRRRHFEIDDDGRNVSLTDAGARVVEQALGGIDLYAAGQLDTLTRLNVALHAHALLRRDVDYIVRDGQVHLVNTSRGRVAVLQRWPDGLQAAVEAKENLQASATGEILDTITIESLVRQFPTKCGATATAVSVGDELRHFYGLEVAVVAPNRPCIRQDEPVRLYATADAKEDAIVAEVAAVHQTGRPVLIGTLDIAESERLAEQLAEAGLASTVLNAKNDAAEAAIIAEAGTLGAITVSTQMAGRGTDIRLGGRHGGRDGGRLGGGLDGGHGGSDDVAELGGLHVVGTGQNWTSRLDGQLRGRAGRQGDPGSSVFFASMEDELIVSYSPDAAAPRDVDPDGRVHDARAHFAAGHAQRAAEGANAEIHRNTFRFNKMTDDQRAIVLDRRDRVLRTDAALSALARACPDRHRQLAASVPPDALSAAARQIVLYHLDRRWAEHLAALADVREGIHLRALGRGDPLTEFHKESIKLFDRFFDQVGEDSAATFESATITADGLDLEAVGLKRPTATWTYVVQDNPFGSDLDRAVRGLRRVLRR